MEAIKYPARLKCWNVLWMKKNTDLFSDSMSALLQNVLTQIKQAEKLLHSAKNK